MVPVLIVVVEDHFVALKGRLRDWYARHSKPFSRYSGRGCHLINIEIQLLNSPNMCKLFRLLELKIAVNTQIHIVIHNNGWFSALIAVFLSLEQHRISLLVPRSFPYNGYPGIVLHRHSLA
jgi:hypothetical protein